MAEAEDVIIDAARHASSYAMELWRRNRVRRGEPAGVALADVRQRLELFLEGALQVRVPVRTASAPAPRTLLSRWLEPGKRERGRSAVPATDGVAIYLPPRIEADSACAIVLYRAATLQQAARN
jgi:nitric oxide reductase NorD protein